HDRSRAVHRRRRLQQQRRRDPVTRATHGVLRSAPRAPRAYARDRPSCSVGASSLRKGGGRVGAPGRWLAGTKSEYPFRASFFYHCLMMRAVSWPCVPDPALPPTVAVPELVPETAARTWRVCIPALSVIVVAMLQPQ